MSARVTEVIDEIAQHREQFERWCRSLSEEELARPVPDSTWQVKDFISHLATIDLTVARWFEAIAEGGGVEALDPGEDEGGGRFDIDHWNDARVAERRDWTLDQIFAEAEETRARIVAALERFDDATIDREIAFGGDSKRPATTIRLGAYLSGWAKHDPIHVNDMLRALPERRRDPEIVAWFEDPAIARVVGGYARSMGAEDLTKEAAGGD